MAESDCFVGDVSGSSESEELDCSLDLVFEEEEGPAIAEDGGGPSDNVPVRAYRYEGYLDADAIPQASTPASPTHGDEAVNIALQQYPINHRGLDRSAA